MAFESKGEFKNFEIAGSSLSVLDIGEGQPVMLGSSYLWDSAMWQPQIEALSGRYRLLVPELWGHGRSGAMPGDTGDLRGLAKQHLELLDRLGIERCAIVGLSVGGMWGAELALLAPERVSALVLMDTSLAAEPAPKRAAYFGMLDAIEALGAVPDPVLQHATPLFFAPATFEQRPELPQQFEARMRNWSAERLRDSVAPLGRMIFGRREALDELSALTMPSLVMTGAEDSARLPAEGAAMAERMGCRFVEIPGAGHIANLEAPEFVTEALTAFLAEALA